MPHYICPIIGTGTLLDPYRPAVADQRVSYAAEIPTDEAGKPVDDWCVVEVAEETRRTKRDADGLVEKDLDGAVVTERVSHTEVLKTTGTEAVADRAAGRLAVAAKRQR
jgi:hypothetical protein